MGVPYELVVAASFIPDDDSFTYVSGFGAADVIQVNYAALGVARTAPIELQAYMNVVTGNTSTDDIPSCAQP